MDFFKDRLLQLLPYADYLFGNEDEAAALGKMMGWGSNLSEIAIKMSEYEHTDAAVPRTVVFTQGCNPTLVCVAGSKTVLEFPVVKLKKEEIVDVNGAGDSFVAGYLSMIVRGVTDVSACVRAGSYAASEILKQLGCTIPTHAPMLELPEH